MKTLELIKKFLNAYFVEHNPEKGLALVTEDIECYGFADDQELHGIEELRKMAASDVYQKFADAKFTIEKEHQVSEESAILNYSLILNSIMIRGRIAGNSRRTSEGNKLYFMNNAMLNHLQTLHVFEETARSKRDKLARELFIQSIPGGLMGGYMEPGFPFYFINDTMLRYLGYESEEEFVENIHGLIDNCFYREDRETVNQEVDEQITAAGEYDIEYRMLKKDGNYIWVHDIGKKIVAEDGRNAILSVCYDITSEKEHELFLKGVMKGFNGDMAVFAVDLEKKRLISTYVSDNMGMHEGISKEEFIKRSAESSLNSVYKEDRQRTWNAICDAAQKGDTPSISFRVIDQRGKACWVNATFSKYGEHDGMPTVLALFADSTIQNDLQLYALSQNGTGITVIDADTHEVYFANDAIFYMLGSEPLDYTNKLCPDILLGCGGSCKDCRMQEVQEKAELNQIIEINGKWLSFHGERCEWAGKPVVSIYAIDVTEKHQLQKQLEDVFENLPGGVVMYRWHKKELYPIYVSKGFSDLYGEDGEDVIRRAKNLHFDAVHPDDLPGLQSFILKHIEKTGQFMTCRYRVWNKQQNDYIWIQLSGNVKRQLDGASIAYANYANVDAEMKAAEEIQREEELLEKTCRLANIWMFYYNLQTKQLRLSKTLQEDFRLPATIENYPEGFLTYPVIGEEYRDTYRQMVQKVDAGEDSITEMPVKLPDGTSRIVRFEWHITKEKNGKAVEIAGLPVDITKEVAERRRMENERQKLLGGDKQLTAYSITDLQKEIIVETKNYYLNVQFQSGETCESFNAKVVTLLLSKEDRQRFLKMRDPRYAIRQYEAGITEWTADMQWKNAKGHIRWKRSVYSILENGDTGTLYLYCYLYDIMDEKVQQDMFAGIQENLYVKATVLSLSTGQICEYEGDEESRRLKITDYDEIRKAYAATEVLPEDAEMEMEQSSLKNVQKQLCSGKKSFSFIHRVRKNGEIRHHQVFFAMVPQRDDACICVVRDITDLVMDSEQRNEELQRALTAANAATQAKSEFLSRMSHEIRTPMNAIMGMTVIAQDNKSDFLQVSDCLTKIDSSSRYLLTLINDILEMSRIESGNTKLSEDRFDFAEMMEQIRVVTEPIAKKSEIRLEIANRTSNGSYYGDSIRIQQVMINLLGNALKFTKKSGRVRFAVSTKEETEAKATFEFTVEDTGIGMSEAFMKIMFEPFSQEDSTITSQYGGSGLGLAISKSLVEAMGGTITAESMVGIGTNFIVRISLKKAQRELLLKFENKNEMPEAEQNAILKGKRILMAEDHPMNIMIAKKLLERKGIQLTVAENGKIAVDTFLHSAPNEYDAILMDIRMPLMDGLEATRQIRALDRPDAKEIPIIAITANALEEDRKNSKASGMDEHLAKPIDPKIMYQILTQQIARRTK